MCTARYVFGIVLCPPMLIKSAQSICNVSEADLRECDRRTPRSLMVLRSRSPINFYAATRSITFSHQGSPEKHTCGSPPFSPGSILTDYHVCTHTSSLTNPKVLRLQWPSHRWRYHWNVCHDQSYYLAKYIYSQWSSPHNEPGERGA